MDMKLGHVELVLDVACESHGRGSRTRGKMEFQNSFGGYCLEGHQNWQPLMMWSEVQQQLQSGDTCAVSSTGSKTAVVVIALRP